MDNTSPLPQSFPTRLGRSDAIYDSRQNSQRQDTANDDTAGTSTSFKQSDNLTGNEEVVIDQDGTNKSRTSGSSVPAAPSRIRRRNRMITSCLECRRRKLKCDRLHPCTNCAKFKRDCVFLAPALDSKSRMKLAELKDKMGSLEKVLEQDVAGKGAGDVERHTDTGDKDTREQVGYEGRSGEGQTVREGGYGDGPVPEDEADLVPTQMAVQDAAYEDEADDDTFDLGFRLGKMRMTDRVGGLFRPKISDEVTEALKSLSINDESSKEGKSTPLKPPPRLRDLLPAEKDAYFQPGPSFVEPRTELLFGSGSTRKHTLFDFLPSKYAANTLMDRYWEAVHPISKVVHRPSFEKRYNVFWADVSRGLEPSHSLQAVVFAAMFSAVISMPERTVLSTFGVPQKNLIENFQLGTEMALGKAHFLKTTKTETLQALVMYLIPMCRSELSRSHSTLVGAAIRLAECMGFHRDPSEYGLPPVETHVRRMIWYQLCLLDVRTSDVQGPRPTIRREDFSTRFPLNVDDRDLEQSDADLLRDMDRWTDMTFTRIRIECCEFWRIVHHDNARLDRKAVSITHVLGKIESFRKACYAKYGPLLNGKNQQPIQRAASLVLTILITRLYIAVLHRYHNSVFVRIPDRLRQLILTTGTQQMESSIMLETSPELQTWVWYSGAYQLYHVAFLLLLEVFMNPMRREADRIWRCLDYIYEVPSLPPESEGRANCEITRKELIEHRARKAAFVLTQLRDRMSAYREMRKLKVPVSMRNAALCVKHSGVHIGSDFIMSNKPAHLRDPEKQNAADTGLDDKTADPQPLKPSSEGSKLATAMPTPSNPSDISYPAQSTHTYYPGLVSQRPDHSYSYPESQYQTQLPRQPQVQNNLQFYPPWQPQVPQVGPSSQGIGYVAAAPSTQPPIYGQQGIDYTPLRGQSLESDTTSSESSGGAGWWFMSSTSMEMPGAGAAPPPPTQSSPQGNPTMMDIDWNEWDKLFPPEINTGDLNLPPQVMEDQPISMDASFYSFPSSDPSYYQK